MFIKIVVLSQLETQTIIQLVIVFVANKQTALHYASPFPKSSENVQLLTLKTSVGQTLTSGGPVLPVI